jgi:hypothetical protein
MIIRRRQTRSRVQPRACPLSPEAARPTRRGSYDAESGWSELAFSVGMAAFRRAILACAAGLASQRGVPGLIAFPAHAT